MTAPHADMEAETKRYDEIAAKYPYGRPQRGGDLHSAWQWGLHPASFRYTERARRRHAVKRNAKQSQCKPRAQRLLQLLLASKVLIEGTAEGYRDLESGRAVSLTELKRRLRNV